MSKNSQPKRTDSDIAAEVKSIISCVVSFEEKDKPKYETTSQVVTISPEAAGLILDDYNKKNRTLSEPRARGMSKLMRNGEWKDCVSSISFGTDGMLLDGQHRLRACVLSKRPLTITVVNGVPNENITRFDIGRNRTGGDTLKMYGVSNSTLLGAAIRKILVLERCYGKPVTQATWSHPISNQDILDWYKKYEYEDEDNNKKSEIHDAIEITTNNNSKYRWATTSTLVAMYWLFGHGSEADRFLNDLISGEGLISVDPVYALRQKLLEHQADRRHEDADVLALYIDAWNARQEGRQLRWYDARTLARRLSGEKKSKIPEDAIRLRELTEEFPRPLPPAEEPHVYKAKAQPRRKSK